MKVEHVILADSAQVADGKLYILGGVFGLVRCASFPMQHPMAVAVTLLFDAADVGREHLISFRFTDPDGTDVLPQATLKVAVGSPEFPEADGRALFVMNIQVPIQKPGRYTQTVAAGTGESQLSASFTAIPGGQQIELIPPPPPPIVPPARKRGR